MAILQHWFRTWEKLEKDTPHSNSQRERADGFGWLGEHWSMETLIRLAELSFERIDADLQYTLEMAHRARKVSLHCVLGNGRLAARKMLV